MASSPVLKVALKSTKQLPSSTTGEPSRAVTMALARILLEARQIHLPVGEGGVGVDGEGVSHRALLVVAFEVLTHDLKLCG
jgi:hypothetical protein